MFAQWLILSCLVTQKGVVFVSGLTQSVATPCDKNENNNAFYQIKNYFWNDYAICKIIL